MSSTDAIWKQNIAAQMDDDGDPCTIRRPHTVSVAGSAPLSSLVLRDPVSINDATITLEHPTPATRLEGKIPSGLILTLAGTDYTVQADAAIEKAATPSVTVSILPVIVAPSVAGTTVDLAPAALFTGTDSIAPRFWLNVESDTLTGGSPIVSRVFVIQKGGNAPADLNGGGTDGDFIDDAAGNNLGRIDNVIDDTPGYWQVAA